MGWARAYYSLGMKTWVLLAAAVLAPLAASAQIIEANEGVRSELLKDAEAARAALLPQTEPLPQLTLRYQPRLNDIKAQISAARTLPELSQGQKDLAAWKTSVLQEAIALRARGEAAPGWNAERQGFAAQSFQGDADRAMQAAARDSWDRYFDNQYGYSRQAPAAVAAPRPLPANDPARYAKIRALLLSQGVSSKIVDTSIAEGIRQKVDPMIVLSVINQESNFRKNAYNRGSGCTGLMQLDPDTARDMGVRGNLYDAATNIKAGVKYMNWIANSFFKMNLDMSDLSKVPAEKLKMVLASYNWGIGNVQRIVRKYGTAGLDRVAPKETRNYIAEIPSRIYNWFASF